jgi:hypothetical protein
MFFTSKSAGTSTKLTIVGNNSEIMLKLHFRYTIKIYLENNRKTKEMETISRNYNVFNNIFAQF